MDQPSRQLQSALHESIRGSLRCRRPILTHLNADTSWLLQLPYPLHARRHAGRSRLNILIDPWYVDHPRRSNHLSNIPYARFRGSQSDVASWFSCQWHATKSCIQSIAELNDLLQEIERIAQECESQSHRQYIYGPAPKLQTNYIDAVIVSHEFTDHCNRLTLLELDTATPIYATGAAAQLIRSWDHFDTVNEIPPFDCTKANWRSTSLATLPDWLGISRMVKEGDALYYHSAILIGFDLHEREDALTLN